ncbi:uncharacterized protein LOC112681090 [Sipha flava]|uniref:Uncharacterized protein LOC112681090 n=1 Tax=Sipha flava TaxID=143950 RepID=A0A8B8F8H7_9HEMI|nr:uncharacterized protein LOC112681090 [Sipha flava]
MNIGVTYTWVVDHILDLVISCGDQKHRKPSTFQIIPSTFFQQELIVNDICVAVVFANIDAIYRYREELTSVELVGVDARYKTVPQVPGNLRSFLTFQVLYKDVTFPMVYALLRSETQETYSSLLTLIRNILPLRYNRISFITDYERGLMNAIREIFPDSQLVCCWFHYTNKS